MAEKLYATVDEVKQAVGATRDVRDDAVEQLIHSVSDHISKFCNRPDGFLADKEASAREYAGSGGPIQRIDECVAITLVEVKSSPDTSTYQTWTTDDWIAFTGSQKRPNFSPLSLSPPKPYQSLMINRAAGDYTHFTSGRTAAHLSGFPPLSDDLHEQYWVPTVRVTARWGYAVEVPDIVKQATIMMVLRYEGRQMGKMADAVGAPDLGRLFFVKKLDADIEQLLLYSGLKKPVI